MEGALLLQLAKVEDAGYGTRLGLVEGLVIQYFILQNLYFIMFYNVLEVRGPSGPQLLVGGPSGRLDFVLRALRALRPRLTHQTRAAEILLPTDGQTNKAILGVGFHWFCY